MGGMALELEFAETKLSDPVQESFVSLGTCCRSIKDVTMIWRKSSGTLNEIYCSLYTRSTESFCSVARDQSV